MKIRYLLLFIFYTSFIYSQKLTEKVGEIEIKAINHHYKYDSDFKLTKRKNNKWNRPYAKIYFDNEIQKLTKQKDLIKDEILPYFEKTNAIMLVGLDKYEGYAQRVQRNSVRLRTGSTHFWSPD